MIAQHHSHITTLQHTSTAGENLQLLDVGMGYVGVVLCYHPTLDQCVLVKIDLYIINRVVDQPGPLHVLTGMQYVQ